MIHWLSFRKRQESRLATLVGCTLSLLAGIMPSFARAQGGLPADALQPLQLAQDAVKNELKLIQYDTTYLRYRVRTRDQKGDQIRDVIESKDGTVARIVRRNDRPLTPDEDSAEHERLQAMLDYPSAFARHIEKDRSGKQIAIDLLKLFPSAMLFQYAPGQPQRSNRSPDEPAELVVDFKPDPKWNPPTLTSEALTGLEGRCWVDQKTHNLMRLEARLFQGINFGFGLFAHIYPGGQFLVEQQPVGDQRWIVNHFVQHVTLRVIIRTIKQDSDLEASNFSIIPAMNYKDAIHLLLSTPLSGAAAPSTSK